MNEFTSLFFELLQVADGTRNEMSRILTDDEWQSVCTIAYRQSMLGVAFYGLDRLPKEQCPSKYPMAKMYGEAEKIRKKNQRLNSTLPFVFEKFREAGFQGVLIKGQGVAQFYPEPMYRTPGDIDIWLKGDRNAIVKFVKSENPEAKAFYHHIDCSEVNNCEIEAHFTPSWMFNPVHNIRLQKWFTAQFENQAANVSDKLGVPVSDIAFNRIFILIHIYRHLFDEGIGLRQVQDYYYVLKQGCTAEERKVTLKTLSSLGLLGFAGAVMYVLKEVFNMDDRSFLVRPDAVRGRMLLTEIIESGNFGYFDRRIRRSPGESEASGFVRRMKRIIKFAKLYPSEVLFAPIFKVYNYFVRHSL